MTERIVIGMEKLRFKTFVVNSDAISGVFGGGGVPGLCILHVRFDMSVKSNSAVAMFSSNGCSNEIDMCVQDNALTSNITIFSKSKTNVELTILHLFLAKIQTLFTILSNTTGDDCIE